ncbi:unnamed protein product, partial [Ilex paraguariensis]
MGSHSGKDNGKENLDKESVPTKDLENPSFPNLNMVMVNEDHPVRNDYELPKSFIGDQGQQNEEGMAKERLISAREGDCSTQDLADDSSFLLEHNYSCRNDPKGVMDDDRGLICCKSPPFKGYHSDFELSPCTQCYEVNSPGSELTEAQVSVLPRQSIFCSSLLKVTRSSGGL